MSEPGPVDCTTYLSRFPPVWTEDSLRRQIARQLRENRHCIVALDDDPTGTQTVHDIWVVTDWEVDTIQAALVDGEPALYILTNSRSLTLPEAQSINKEVATNLIDAARRARRPISVVSRSDSTLRGHYPGEVIALGQALIEEALYPVAGVCIIPFFPEGGRFTAEDVHWVREDDQLIPAAQTPYARDSVFGYVHSHLPSWVEEKTVGRVPVSNVTSVTLGHLRRGGPDQVCEILMGVKEGGVVIVNALDYRDLEVFVVGSMQAEREGKKFLFRTAASFVKVAAGIEDKALLLREELVEDEKGAGGLIVFGSHVPKSNAQLEALRSVEGVETIELPVRDVLLEEERQNVIERACSFINGMLAKSMDSVIYTSREVVLGLDSDATLDVGKQVSSALVEVIQRVEVQPRYVIAKGGITSSDVATKALGIRAARVLGQVYPGVPAWKMGEESRWPGLAYVVFPGNVGEAETVAEIVKMLR